MIRITACAAALACAAAPVSAATSITLADFVNPIIEDFESAALGPSAGVFASVDVVSVGFTGSSDSDGLGTSYGASQTLWGDSNGLRIVAPGTTSLSDVVTYEISFGSTKTRFGFGLVDQAGVSTTLSFYLAGTLVDTATLTTNTNDANLLHRYFQAATFDMVSFSYGSGGIGLDDFTIEASELNGAGADVPLPMTALLLPAALAGFGVIRRRG